MSLFYVFLSLLLLPLAFIIQYLITWGGLRILGISGISKSKIVGYIIISGVLGILLFLMEGFLKPLIEFSAGTRSFVSYFINSLFGLVTNFLLLKYYLHLSGKELWKFFLYLTITGLILSGIISWVF